MCVCVCVCYCWGWSVCDTAVLVELAYCVSTIWPRAGSTLTAVGFFLSLTARAHRAWPAFKVGDQLI